MAKEKNEMNIIARIILILFILLTSSCNRKKDTIPLNVIPVASTVGNYNVLNLSDFASEIRYIPLETNDQVLISPINLEIIYENEKVLIRDHSPTGSNCYLFDDSGKFCVKIGQRGQGPDEYVDIDNISVYENLIYLMTWHKLLVYDTTGHLVENINLRSEELPMEFRKSALRKIIPLKKNAFVVDVVTVGSYPTAFLFETNQSIVETIKEYPSSVKLDKPNGGYGSAELGKMYRYEDEVRIYKPINDTIFTISQNKHIKTAFIFELGKYRVTLAYWEWKGLGGDAMERLMSHNNMTKNFIFLSKIYESFNHLFIKFDFGNHSPEPYETSHLGQKYTAYDVYSVFDKRTGVLTLMRQPIKGNLGFKNDIDNGPIIFPHYISSNNELVTFIQPEEFMEYYNKTQNPSAELKKIADKLQIDDNPIIIVAKLK